jgi:hypothetical protein
MEAWHDGVTVTVGTPKEFKPSEYAAADKTMPNAARTR